MNDSLRVFRLCGLAGVLSSQLLFAGNAAAKELETPWSLYIAAVEIATTTGRITACLNDAQTVCEEGRDYCLMSVEEKISYQLQVCFEEKLACDTGCNNDYQTCVDLGTPSATCHAEQELCYTNCETAGTQCQLDAINGEYVQLPAEVCDSEYAQCIDKWYAVCVTEY